MAHSVHHAESSARRFGGVAEDYIALHSWFDASKAHEALPIHRALRHHSFGIFEAETVFGSTILNSAGRSVPTRFLGEQHVLEDCRRIPSVSDWLRSVPVASWMVNGALLSAAEMEPVDTQEAWRSAVAAGRTVLGLAEWLPLQDEQPHKSMA